MPNIIIQVVLLNDGLANLIMQATCIFYVPKN